MLFFLRIFLYLNNTLIWKVIATNHENILTFRSESPSILNATASILTRGVRVFNHEIDSKNFIVKLLFETKQKKLDWLNDSDWKYQIFEEKIQKREKRSEIFFPTDPEFKNQWYLFNHGQSTGPSQIDINVLPVWRKGITGKGVIIGIVDDGVDYTHPDLKNNYDSQASYDFYDMDADPMPDTSNDENCHGTRCAGEIAASLNEICGVGVAYGANFGGIRLIAEHTTDSLESFALSFKRDYIDIYSNSWGPNDDGKTFGKPGPITMKALEDGVKLGRGGRGSIFVWATGNGGLMDDNCNCDGYVTSIYTIAIGCISDHGLSVYYKEQCSAMLAVTLNGGTHNRNPENKIITTDLKHRCVDNFKGTSSAAPIAVGIIALVLQANPSLSWRDVQHLIVTTSVINSPLDDGWMKNGAGLHFNTKFGFGMLDASKMVEKAITWKNVPMQRRCAINGTFSELIISMGDELKINYHTDSCKGTENHIDTLEHVKITVSFKTPIRGRVSIDLISPTETISPMLSTRKHDIIEDILEDWDFMTNYHWYENPDGPWIVNVKFNEFQDNNNNKQRSINVTTKDMEDLEKAVLDQNLPINSNETIKADNVRFKRTAIPECRLYRMDITLYGYLKSTQK